MANLYVKAEPPADLNRNTEWFMYPGVWTTYILILFFAWLLVLSIFGCSPGMAWTIVNLAHFVVCITSLSYMSFVSASVSYLSIRTPSIWYFFFFDCCILICYWILDCISVLPSLRYTVCEFLYDVDWWMLFNLVRFF